MSDFWTKKKVEQLKKLVDEGLTFSQIGRQLGCTRNAAVAKCHRMGWKGNSLSDRGWRARKHAIARGEAVPPVKGHRKRPLSARQTAKTPAPAPTPPKKRSRVRLPAYLKTDEGLKGLLELGLSPRGENITDIPGSRSCKWIDGDVKDGTAKWCRKTAKDGSAYCRHHHDRVYLAGTTYQELKKRREQLKEKNK